MAPTPTARTVTEHEMINAQMRRVAAATSLENLLGLLEDLVPSLLAHFEGEEQPNGVIDAMRVAYPNAGVHLQRLVDDHKRMRAELDILVARVQQALDLEHAVRTRVSDFMADIQDHESRESELLVDLVYTDLGDGQ